MRERERVLPSVGVAVATTAAATAGDSRGCPSTFDALLLQFDNASLLEPIRAYSWKQESNGSCTQSRTRKGRTISKSQKQDTRQMQPLEREEKAISPSPPRRGAQCSGALDLPVERRFMLASIVPSAHLAVEGRGTGIRGEFEKGEKCVREKRAPKTFLSFFLSLSLSPTSPTLAFACCPDQFRWPNFRVARERARRAPKTKPLLEAARSLRRLTSG